MRRLILFTLVVALVALGAGCVPQAAAPPVGRPAYMYGDSVLLQANPYLKSGVTQRGLVGASPCGYYQSGQMQVDAQTNPRAVILMFTGLYAGYWCEFGVNRYQAYLNDFQTIKAIFPNAKVYVALPPESISPAAPNDDVVQAAWDSGCHIFDSRAPLDYPTYGRASDGVHLLDDGSQLLAALLSTLYKGGGTRP